MKVKSKSEVVQSCLTLRDPMDWSLPGSSVHGIFQARVLEWVAIAFSNMLSRLVITFVPRSKHLLIYWLQSILKPKCSVSVVLSHSVMSWVFAAQWTVACQVPLSMGFFRQECWGGLPFSPPGHLPDPGIEPTSLLSPALQADSLPTESLGKPLFKPEGDTNLLNWNCKLVSWKRCLFEWDLLTSMYKMKIQKHFTVFITWTSQGVRNFHKSPCQGWKV